MSGWSATPVEVAQRREVGSVAQPQIKLFEQRPKRPTAPSRRTAGDIEPIGLADGRNGPGEIGDQFGAHRRVVAGSPGVGAVDPFEHRPVKRKHLVWLPDMSDCRRGENQRLLDVLQNGDLLDYACCGVGPTGKSNHDIRRTASRHAPHRIVGTRRVEVLQGCTGPLRTLSLEQRTDDLLAGVWLIVMDSRGHHDSLAAPRFSSRTRSCCSPG